MNARRLALAAGVGLLAAGVAALAAPNAVPVSLDRAAVVVIGVAALGQAARVIQRRRNARHDAARTPDPERSVSATQPGEDMGTVLGPFFGRRRVYPHTRRIRDGLTKAAVAVLAQFEGLTESDARERIDAGTWTGDSEAASFLGGAGASDRPLRTRLRDRLARRSPTERRIRRTVDAIVDVVEQRTGSDPGPASEVHDQKDAGSAPQPNGSDRRASTTDEYSFDDGADGTVSRTAHPTGHWRGVSVVALVGIGVGVLVEQPAVLLGGVVGIGYAAYARSSALPPGSVSVRRTVSAERPDAGESVTVSVSVTNKSGRVLPDVRVVDGVPEALAVESGSPRCGTALRPGATASFSYAVTARRGVHEFGPARVVERDVAGATEEERLCAADTTLTCVPSLSTGTEQLPLREAATRYVGREPTAATGAGVEFSATREYRPGDPMNRIDWNRRARTGELTTIEFREERAATVVLLVDARAEAYVAPQRGANHAVDRAVDAAGHLFAKFTDAGNRVGIAAAGAESCWLPPDTGAEHRAATRELLATSPALSPVPTEQRGQSQRWQSALRSRLESGTQVVFLSPLADDAAVEVARQFEERGFPVTAVSPDPTTRTSPSRRLAWIVRQVHVSRLRGAGVPVVDWAWTEPLDAALARYDKRGVR